MNKKSLKYQGLNAKLKRNIRQIHINYEGFIFIITCIVIIV